MANAAASQGPNTSTTLLIDDSYCPLNTMTLARKQLDILNSSLNSVATKDLLRWCMKCIPSLYQQSSLGLSGLVAVDIMAGIARENVSNRLSAPGVIFLDTLHHFPETIETLETVKSWYPNIEFHVYRPRGCETSADFARNYGNNLWETDQESYDYHAKVEPNQRALVELKVNAVITGRRREQGGSRAEMSLFELDEAGILKINPLANWSFGDVHAYVQTHGLPYNTLVDQGYRSIGDWHSTKPVTEGDGERDGRWKGSDKTECGIHNPKSRYAQFLAQSAEQAA